MYIFLYLVFVHAISAEPLDDKPYIWRILRIKVFGDILFKRVDIQEHLFM